MKLYLDANIFITAVEGEIGLGTRVGRFLGVALSRGMPLTTSEMTLAEVLVNPFERASATLIDAYLGWFAGLRGLDVVPVDRAILVRAAAVRAARKSIRLPDAIHVATAEASGASHFLTDDARLQNLGGRPLRFHGTDSIDALEAEMAASER